MRVSPGWETVFGVLAILAVAPLFVVTYPPIQDLPQHLAAVRVLHDFSTPGFHFRDFFELHLGRTQYLTFYLLSHALAHAFGVLLSTKLVIAAGIVGLPYSMRYLLAGLGRDPRLALFVLPLTWNAHLLFGFFNFVCAIPLALLGIGVAVRLRSEWSLRHAVLLGVVAVATFYTHVVPFGFLLLGAALVAWGGGMDATLRRLAPLVPALFAAVYWARENPAAGALRALVRRNDNVLGPTPEFQSPAALVAEPTKWLTDVLRSSTDTWCFFAWGALVVLTLALGGRAKANRSQKLRLELLAPLAVVAWFVLPESYDWIWPINGRFPLLACVFVLFWIRDLRSRFALQIYAGVALVSALGFVDVALAFRKSERDEQGDIQGAIAAIPEGQKVAGLVWDRGSRYVNVSPFVHAVALYQASRGGAVMFTFADSPQSPFAFRTNDRPPRVPLGWEWSPEAVDPTTDLAWFDWVITRGGPGSVHARSQDFEIVFEKDPWRVYRRIRR